jgi:branched-chain amino acid transport system substrate-binding protein
VSGAAPDTAKRFAQELVVRDKVDVIVGLDFSPNAFAVAAISSQAKIPTIVMNAASSAVTIRSPYIARVSFTVPQVSAPMAQWALKNGITDSFVVVSDYASGIDADAAFTKAFRAGGGKIAGSLKVPMNNPDFSGYVQRIKDAKPQAVFFFFPSGQLPNAFIKAADEAGLRAAGIKLIATGEATDDSFLDAMGDTPIGLITAHHYSMVHDSAKNKAYVAAYRDQFGNDIRPSYMSVAAYDGLAVLDAALKKQPAGKLDGDQVMAALKGIAIESPRGPISVDAETRDIVQTVYIRRTEKVDGRVVNVEFDKVEAVKDPGKE